MDDKNDIEVITVNRLTPHPETGRLENTGSGVNYLRDGMAIAEDMGDGLKLISDEEKPVMKTVQLTATEAEFIRGRMEVESEWGPDVYDAEQQKVIESIKEKVS